MFGNDKADSAESHQNTSKVHIILSDFEPYFNSGTFIPISKPLKPLNDQDFLRTKISENALPRLSLDEVLNLLSIYAS